MLCNSIIEEMVPSVWIDSLSSTADTIDLLQQHIRPDSMIEVIWLNGYVVEEGQWYLQCGVSFQTNLSRPEGNSSPSINEFNNMQMLISNFNPSVSEDEWHASGEEAFLVPLSPAK